MTFELGQVVATPAALELLGKVDMWASEQVLARHASGDWGDLDAEDKKLNDQAVAAGAEGGRLLSAYVFEGGKVWVITEADRSVTTILLPEEH